MPVGGDVKPDPAMAAGAMSSSSDARQAPLEAVTAAASHVKARPDALPKRPLEHAPELRLKASELQTEPDLQRPSPYSDAFPAADDAMAESVAQNGGSEGGDGDKALGGSSGDGGGRGAAHLNGGSGASGSGTDEGGGGGGSGGESGGADGDDMDDDFAAELDAVTEETAAMEVDTEDAPPSGSSGAQHSGGKGVGMGAIAHSQQNGGGGGSSSSGGGGGGAAAAAPVLFRINVNDVSTEPPPGAAAAAAQADAAVRAATAAVEAMRAAQGASSHSAPDASSSAWSSAAAAVAAAPAAAPALPPPTPAPSGPVPCLRGVMRPAAGGGWICEGLWGMTKEAHEPGQPEGSTSKFTFSCSPPAPSAAFPMDPAAARAAAEKMAEYPYSGAYQGRVSIYQGPGKGRSQILEKDLHLAFRKNSAGGWNVEGSGSNKIGAFQLFGTLQPDGDLEVFKQYLPRDKLPASPRGGITLQRGRSDASFSSGSRSKAKPARGSASMNGDYVDSDEGYSSEDSAAPARGGGAARRASRVSSDGGGGGAASGDTFRKCAQLLQSLLNVKSKSHWFAAPVDPVALNIPEYPRIIKHPMDLGTIRSKLDGGIYNTVDEFIADVRLTFNNAIQFNTNPSNLVNIAARELKAMFEERLASTRQGFDAGAPLKRKKSSGGGGGAYHDPYANLEAAMKSRKSGGGGGGGSSKRSRPNPGGPRRATSGGGGGVGMETYGGAAGGVVTVPMSQLEEMQRRMEDMTRRMAEMEQRAAAGGGAGAALPLPHSPPPAEPAAPLEPLTFDEKRQLSEDINHLMNEPEKLARVVAIIQEHMPLGSSAEEEVELDLDAMDTPLLRALQSYIAECDGARRKGGAKRKRQGGGAYGSDSSDDEF